MYRESGDTSGSESVGLWTFRLWVQGANTGPGRKVLSLRRGLRESVEGARRWD